jgi:ribosome-associated protein
VPSLPTVPSLGIVRRGAAQNAAMNDLAVTSALVIPARELDWRFSRSSGPGGQSVNTADTRVELSFDVAASPSLSHAQRQRALQRLADRLVDGVLTVAASEHRSQLRNRQAAMARLADVLREATRPPAAPRRKTKPSRGAQEQRLAAKKRRSMVKRWRRPAADD